MVRWPLKPTLKHICDVSRRCCSREALKWHPRGRPTAPSSPALEALAPSCAKLQDRLWELLLPLCSALAIRPTISVMIPRECDLAKEDPHCARPVFVLGPHLITADLNSRDDANGGPKNMAQLGQGKHIPPRPLKGGESKRHRYHFG